MNKVVVRVMYTVSADDVVLEEVEVDVEYGSAKPVTVCAVVSVVVEVKAVVSRLVIMYGVGV